MLDCAVNPGFGGQGFIQSQISKIARLRQMCNELGVNPWIEVDGGIGPGNAAEVSSIFTPKQLLEIMLLAYILEQQEGQARI